MFRIEIKTIMEFESDEAFARYMRHLRATNGFLANEIYQSKREKKEILVETDRPEFGTVTRTYVGYSEGK